MMQARRVPLSHFLPAAYMPADTGLCLTDLVIDSRDVVDGCGFIALKGTASDGRDYIEAALSNGAEVAFADLQGTEIKPLLRKRIINIPEIESRYISLAESFYDAPSQALEVFAVTGTNGKTTVCQLIAQLLNAQQALTGYIGTLGWQFDSLNGSTRNTTPDPVSVRRIMRDMSDAGCRYVALEMSSHALHQGRDEGLHVTTAVYTNLSRDHLDYHADMQDYAETKKRLFERRDLSSAVINIGDAVGKQFYNEFAGRVPCTSYALRDTAADYHVLSERADSSGSQVEIATPRGAMLVNVPLLGEFNLENCLAAVAAVAEKFDSLTRLAAAVSNLRAVTGRMQVVSAGQSLVVVDYAHTPEGLRAALQAMRRHSSGELWVMFGCGGDRDRGKRSMMGAEAEALADKVIVTSDNPRTEDPQVIVQDILSGMRSPSDAVVVIDRAQAINETIASMPAGTALLIAGKGHETEQIIGQTALPFSDYSAAEQALWSIGGKDAE